MDFGSISNTFNDIYRPAEQLYQQQLQAIPGQFTAKKTALEQAKTNAFRDIGTQAQDKGLFYSGYQPLKQGEYTGSTYLPGLANIATEEAQQRFDVLGALQKLLVQKGENVFSAFDKAQQRGSAERIAQNEINAILEAARIGG